MNMEFKNLQKIWDNQNDNPPYVIDEEVLHNYILAKKKQVKTITNLSELFLIILNIFTGILTIGINSSIDNIYLYIMAVWMFCTSFYLARHRIRRIAKNKHFDRSMRGDLDNAIETASYQVRLSQMMRWNALPIAALCLAATLEGRKPIWIIVLMMLFFLIISYFGKWEDKFYKSKKRKLELFKEKLVSFT